MKLGGRTDRTRAGEAFGIGIAPGQRFTAVSSSSPTPLGTKLTPW